MALFTSCLDALQLAPAQPSTEDEICRLHATLISAMHGISCHFESNVLHEEGDKVYKQCIAAADRLCRLKDDFGRVKGLEAMRVAVQHCSKTLFLKTFPDMSLRANSLARGSSVAAARAAAECLVQIMQRLHTFMTAQGVKAAAAQCIAQVIASAAYMLQGDAAVVHHGLLILRSVLDCMPQAAKSSYSTLSASCHAVMQNQSLHLDDRILAAHVLAALPASQSTADAHSQHLQGLMRTIHTVLSSMPSPPTDPGAAQAACDVLGTSIEGSWSQCALLKPPRAASQYVPPQQRLGAITLLLECLDETLQRRTEMAVPLPMTALVLLVSRLLAHRPSLVHHLSQHSPADRAQLHLLGGPLLNSGLVLLKRLLAWPHLVVPMASATCFLLCELLQAASATPRLPAQTRTHLYRSAHAVLCAFGLPAAEPITPALMKCAWTEFSHASGPSGAAGGMLAAGAAGQPTAAGAAQPAAGRQGNKKRRKVAQGGKPPPAAAKDSGAAAAVEQSHRPANAQHVMACQVAVLECITAVHDVSTGALPAVLQAELDTFTVTTARSAARTAQLAQAWEPRMHTAGGAAAVLRAATACAAALCRTGQRRGPRWRPPPELLLCLRAPAVDAAQGVRQSRAVCLTHASAARVADDASAHVPLEEPEIADVAARVRAVMKAANWAAHEPGAMAGHASTPSSGGDEDCANGVDDTDLAGGRNMLTAAVEQVAAAGSPAADGDRGAAVNPGSGAQPHAVHDAGAQIIPASRSNVRGPAEAAGAERHGGESGVHRVGHTSSAHGRLVQPDGERGTGGRPGLFGRSFRQGGDLVMQEPAAGPVGLGARTVDRDGGASAGPGVSAATAPRADGAAPANRGERLLDTSGGKHADPLPNQPELRVREEVDDDSDSIPDIDSGSSSE
eukprot:jgi/Ulvmu1/5006/UM021_0023.1